MGCGEGRPLLSPIVARRRSFAPSAAHVEFATVQPRLPVARHRMPEAFVEPMLRYCCLVLGAASAITLAAGPDYPSTARRPVTETYHGVTVVDEYRWLEDDASPEVKRWVAEQNALTRRYLDALPQRPAIAARVGELLRMSPVRRYDFEYRSRLFALKLQPPKNQPILVALPVSGDIRGERVVLDLNVLDPSGKTAIDFFRPSYDGKRVVVSLSTNGSEDGTAYD